MNRYSHGQGTNKSFYAVVVDVKDPEEAGRLKVRLMGYQGDKANIPDGDLHWARLDLSPTNAAHKGVGEAHVGAVVGSWVKVYYDEGDQQLRVTSSIGGIREDSDKDADKIDPAKNHDFPRAARTAATKGGDYAYDGKAKRYRDKSITEYAKTESPNAFGRPQSRDANESPSSSWSLGGHQFIEV